MTFQVDIQTDVVIPDRIDKVLESTILITLAQHAIPSAALTLLLTDDKRMRQLNQDFRGIDKSTDVLSFPGGDPLPTIGDMIPYLGDIAISIPVARNQARTSGHTLIAELQLLAVHGVLHLLGYDHVLPKDKVRMWSAQEKMLNLLGLRDILPTEV
jgi:probable rRNA maturation factor